jgi:hypothetical protein
MLRTSGCALVLSGGRGFSTSSSSGLSGHRGPCTFIWMATVRRGGVGGRPAIRRRGTRWCFGAAPGPRRVGVRAPRLARIQRRRRARDVAGPAIRGDDGRRHHRREPGHRRLGRSTRLHPPRRLPESRPPTPTPTPHPPTTLRRQQRRHRPETSSSPRLNRSHHDHHNPVLQPHLLLANLLAHPPRNPRIITRLSVDDIVTSSSTPIGARLRQPTNVTHAGGSSHRIVLLWAFA